MADDKKPILRREEYRAQQAAQRKKQHHFRKQKEPVVVEVPDDVDVQVIAEKTPNASSEKTAQDKMISGSIWMTAGSVFSRVLGAIYIIPWLIWMGSNGNLANALYAKAYQVYSIFLVISTAGVPGAISKQVAHYNALDEYEVGQRLYRHGLVMMTLMGIISMLIMYFGAPVFAVGSPQLTMIFRALSWALLIIPILSITRGFFQGYSEMAPSALSQFIEQVARVVYMLVTCYLIMKVFKGSYVDAVAQSTFAAFIGASAGLLLLIFYYLNHLNYYFGVVQHSKHQLKISTNKNLWSIIQQAIPYIIMDAGISIFYLVDQYTFNPIMLTIHHFSKDTLDSLFALFAFNANKLIMIIVSLATAMAITATPLLSAAYTRNNTKVIGKQVNDMLQLFFFVMVPAAIGLSAVADPLYTIFYGRGPVGIAVLKLSAYVAIILGLYTVMAAILQALYQNRKAIWCLVVGFVVKIALQYPCIHLFQVYGPMIATALGFIVASTLMLRAVIHTYHINMMQTMKRLLVIVIFSALMFIVAWGSIKIMQLFLNPNSRLNAMITIIISVVLGALVYIYCVLKTRLADKILGAKVARLRHLLRIS